MHPVWTKGWSAGYLITVAETRDCEDTRLGRPSRFSMTWTLHLNLECGPIDRDGQRSLRCRFDRIELKGESDGRAFGYDSKRDKAGAGNPYADLLANLVSPSLKEFQIRARPDGAFVEVRGLDSMWREKRLLVAPAAVLPVQLLFRDQAMLRLLEDAVSPPLPANVAEGPSGMPAYAVTLPAEIPLVTPLVWCASFRVLGRDSTGGQPCIHIDSSGPLHVQRHPDDPSAAGLLATVEKGERQADIRLDEKTGHVVHQTISQEVVLSLQLKAPAGGDSPRMTLRQSRTMTVALEGKAGGSTS